MNTNITNAFQDYLDHTISGWELLEVVQYEGFQGFTVTEALTLLLHP